ncbi:RluA family pseudouridine synthase [Candidatus Karelsulcia muelleri]|uniref:RluA family pseudouridine synthase n=1 Tax=Candidatus Karelsulcia muelleri TaxID=336810 RepID=UPI002363BBFE|nr:RluA family pseudouridine synthase [Candidatus Karelsulcia muelleri]WDE42209.1 RluA family pseudouridine synthase [Candidatus Karelsulcia muelleri]
MHKRIIRKYYKFIFKKQDVAARLDNYLIDKLPKRYTRNIIQKIIILGNVYINKKQIKNKKHLLKSKDRIEIFTLYLNKKEAILKCERLNLSILYEDEYLLIINKQFNLVVHPGTRNQEGTLLNGIKYLLENKAETRIQLKKPYIANRIDKETSGLIMVATDEKIVQNLSKQFSLNWIKKKYIAVVNGIIKEEQINKISKIVISRKKGKSRKKVCFSTFKVIERLRDLTVLKCIISSGRTHQIRVHLKELGYTIFNEKKYSIDKIYYEKIASYKKKIISRIIQDSKFLALHAKSLELIHPIFLKYLQFTSIIPFEIYMLIKIMF